MLLLLLNTSSRHMYTLKMGTPAHLALALAKHVTTICMVVFTALVVFNFLYVLHTEHATARQRLLDDQWLFERCGEPDFYIRLKQHTDLCEGVEANARRSILLHSFTAALRNTQLCGFDTCANIAQAVVETILRGGIITMAMAVTIVFTVPVVSMLMYRRFVDGVAENHLRTKYNMPYGLNTSLLHSQHEQASAHAAYNTPLFRPRLIGDYRAAPSAHVYESMHEHTMNMSP